ncbi:MAG: radical SAM protein [Candidatus Schekmanbacteria bacterium]|nr:radical SAM protein [Candidatus Schekmanbacteria bacterium]
MLMVSDLVDVAKNAGRGAADVGASARLRFDRRRGTGVAVVVWNVCRHCNMSCPHCYAAATAAPSPKDLTTAEALALTEQLAEVGADTLILSGGEPLLRADLFAIASRARALGLTLCLSSNGVLIDAEVAGKLADVGFSYVGISIDGVPAFNDAYRGLAAATDRALAGLRLARAAGLRTGVRMTITRRNVKQLPDVLAMACADRADRFYVSHLVYAGRGHAMAAEDLTRVEARESLRELFARAAVLAAEGSPTRVVTGSNDSDGVLLLGWLAARFPPEGVSAVRELLERRGGNSAGEKLLAIDHQGHVLPDQFWHRGVLGSVRQEPLAHILEHPFREELRTREARLGGRCAACSHVGLCRGSHRERALAHFGDVWAEDPACLLLAEELGAGSGCDAATSHQAVTEARV